MTCLRHETRTARKVHQCDYCLGPIEPGERYHSSFCVDGGDCWGWRSHRICASLAEQWRKAGGYYSDEGMDASGWGECLYGARIVSGIPVEAS